MSHRSSKSSKPRRLREILQKRTIAIPGAFNALTAMQIEAAGYEVVYISGAAISAAHGLPDLGLLSLTEMVAEAGRIAHAISLPAIVDADTGFGPPLMVMRAVREFERVGLAGMQIEDQELPKKCGHLPGKSLVPADDMAAKIRAAVQARQDPHFLIIARTDARSVEGLHAAIARAQAYVEAGADALFPEALESVEEFEQFARAMAAAGIQVPLFANMTEFGKTPYLSVNEFEALGYRGILFPVTTLRVAARAVEKLLYELKTFGTQRDWLSQIHTRQQINELLHYQDYLERERRLYDHSPDGSDTAS
ncbi:MAG: methylisocitrate lyase [Nitrospirae bacterium]|nr:MAG: methylisocitrate lyase [Nitrospirota bacterium]